MSVLLTKYFLSMKTTRKAKKTVLFGIIAVAAGLCLMPARKQHSSSPDTPASHPASTCSAHHPNHKTNPVSQKSYRYFNKGTPTSLAEIPPCPLRTKLETLAPEIQKKALNQLAEMQFNEHDFNSMRVDALGSIFYVCSFHHTEPQTAAATALTTESASALDEVEYNDAGLPLLHSLPGSERLLFIDFDGHTVSGREWNTEYDVTEWDCPAYNPSGEASTFDSVEQSNIIEIWERVAEDYAPFDIDVTTEEPTNWTRTTGHALVTDTTDNNGVQCPHYGYGGVAYVSTFGGHNQFQTSPVWVTDYAFAKGVAEIVSHEFGHTLGLSHDGAGTNEYYEGHSSDTGGWGPIMGAPYYKTITQWSQGDYYDASNTLQDDLAIIAANLPFKTDDYGDSQTDATHLNASDYTNLTADAIIETTGAPDWFSFTTAAGSVSIDVIPVRANDYFGGNNSDLQLTLYDAAENQLAIDDPESKTTASISELWLDAGTYYVKITPAGSGTPFASTPTGYTDYGCVGEYTLSGSVLNDADADGLPDSWEQLHFQNITNAVASADSDEDGQDNLTEYITGVDPQNANDLFQLTLTEGADGIDLSWPALAGRTYTLLWSTNLITQSLDELEDMRYPQTNYTHVIDEYTNAFYNMKVKLTE